MTLPACYRCDSQPCECKDGWTVEDIQRAILHNCLKRSVRLIAPNICLLMNCEQDMLEITSALYAVEYEIKLTASDYKADFLKTAGYVWRRDAKPKHDVLAGRVDCGSWTLPRRFWFVLPTPIALRIEASVPNHAGLLAATPCRQQWCGAPNLTLTILRKAPVIRMAQKLSVEQIYRVTTSLVARFWDIWKGQWARRLDQD